MYVYLKWSLGPNLPSPGATIGTCPACGGQHGAGGCQHPMTDDGVLHFYDPSLNISPSAAEAALLHPVNAGPGGGAAAGSSGGGGSSGCGAALGGPNIGGGPAATALALGGAPTLRTAAAVNGMVPVAPSVRPLGSPPSGGGVSGGAWGSPCSGGCCESFADSPQINPQTGGLAAQTGGPTAGGLDPSPILTYNSAAASAATEVGNGWTHDFKRRVATSGVSNATVVTGTGNDFAYAFDVAGRVFYIPSGPAQNSLQVFGSGFLETRPDGGQYVYNSGGTLLYLRNPAGARWTMAYDAGGRPLSVAQPVRPPRQFRLRRQQPSQAPPGRRRSDHQLQRRRHRQPDAGDHAGTLPDRVPLRLLAPHDGAGQSLGGPHHLRLCLRLRRRRPTRRGAPAVGTAGELRLLFRPDRGARPARPSRDAVVRRRPAPIGG